jgi:hypothetical protein
MSDYVTDPALLAQLNGTTSDGYVTDPALLEQLNKKSAKERFTEPFKDVSIKDWAEKSLLAPALQTMKMVTPFGMLRPDLATQDLKQGSQNLAGKAQQMAQGAYNVATNPVESAQRAYTAVTENPAGVAGELAKGIMYDPEMLIGSGLGNVVEKTARGAGQVAMAPINAAGGAVGRMTGRIAAPGEAPTGWQSASSRVPLQDTYITPESLKALREGKIGPNQLDVRSIKDLPSNAAERIAMGLSGGEIPVKGQAARAFGERIGETYRNPLTAALDIGSAFATGGIPLISAAKTGVGGARALGDYLMSRKGFESLTPAEIAALGKNQNPFGGAGYGPTNYNAPPGPAVPPKAPYPTWSSPTTPPKGPPPPPAPPAGGAVAPSVNYNTPAYQRQGQQIPGVNAPQTPAQTNAVAMGITPPMTAEQSGFTQQLNTLAKGPAVPEGTPPAFDFAPKTKTDWQGDDWYKTQPKTTGPSSGMSKLVETVRNQPTSEKGADILAKIRARGPQPTTAPNPVEAPVSGPAIPQGQPTTKSVNINPEKETDVFTQAKSVADIRRKLEADPVGQLNTELALAKQEARSAAARAAQGARSDLVSDIKAYTNVTSKNNKLTYDKGNFNELADNLGKKIDWTNAPDITNMPLKQGRREIRKFVYGELKDTGAKGPGKTMINDLFEEVPTSKPGTMSMMSGEDKNKFFNKIKASSESDLERKVAGMTQTNREKLYQTMVDAGADEKTLKPFKDIFEKYRTKK